ncbi:hypothetical protein FEM03_21100 [Phragmitibacter flavus]|uniref:Uncharacterized protein n=1 Tax=Phragmitibacter flavus TaxID=2576071 RepID=A0A5R8K8M0_9BACT|nr:hypothetical protein [Phragmitibacter flavus]TLD68684.1 hypothetical protein FEM03_21100 [Phragmitibacter flavus]
MSYELLWNHAREMLKTAEQPVLTRKKIAEILGVESIEKEDLIEAFRAEDPEGFMFDLRWIDLPLWEVVFYKSLSQVS